MGVLTDDMTRLCGEIRAMRQGRGVLMKDLARAAGDLRETGFTMRARFQNDHARMARVSKGNRLAFLSGLKGMVLDLRHEFATDLAGAHRAWYGPSLAERKAREVEKRRREAAERQARAEAELRAKAEAERQARAEAERQARAEAERRGVTGAENQLHAAVAEDHEAKERLASIKTLVKSEVKAKKPKKGRWR